MKKSYEIDMCNGPLWGKLLLFSVPLILSGILQLLFNAADIVVVGRFSGNHALAAVGSTSSLIQLFVNVFIGCSIGTNVLVGRFCGAKDAKNVSETVHTSILFSIVCGCILIFLGVAFAKPMLEWMATPPEVLGQAVLYMRIFFVGMPAMMLYNFGAAVLRATGDTQRPLYYLLLAGIINVVLNLFFVIVCGLGVAGVALATIISQAVSDAYRRNVQTGAEKAENSQRQAEAHCAYRSSGGDAERHIFHIKCADPVIGKFFWSHCNGWKYGGIQSGGVCIYIYECCLSGDIKFYQSKCGCRESEADQPDPMEMFSTGDSDRRDFRMSHGILFAASSGYLFLRCRGDRLRNTEA